MVLRSHPDLQQRIIDTALGQFPVIGEQLRVGSLRGSGTALAIGIATALWAGMGVTQAFQNAMNNIWDVPKKGRPNFLKSRFRGLMLLVLLGAFALAATVVSGIGTTREMVGILRAVGLLGSLALNLALFLLAFRILTDRDVSWGDILPGAAAAAVLWTVLQSVGSLIVTRQIASAANTYGTFALVIGLLFWIYLGAQITLLCAEINVVRVRRLWPRSIVQPPLNEADERTLRTAAKVEERLPEERVDVAFDEGTVREEKRG